MRKFTSGHISNNVYVAVTLVCLYAIFLVLTINSMRVKSLTSDEGSHLASGFSIWKTKDFRINPEHPPLVKKIAALPLVFRARHIHDLTAIPGWKEGDQWTFSEQLLFHQEIDADDVLFWGRFLMLFFGMATAWVIFLFSRSLWGLWGGFISLFVSIFSPNFLAHSRWVHTDMPVTLGFVLTSYMAFKYHQKQSRHYLIALALALGFACSVKYSGIILIPLVGLAFLSSHAKSLYPLPKKLPQKALLHGLTLCIIPLFLISWTYGSFFNPLLYVKGFLSVYGNHLDNYADYMNGQFNKDGFFFYYPYAMLVKIPLPIWLISLAGCFHLRKIGLQKGILFLIIPPLLMLTAGAITRNNIGVRHVLPCFPFLFILAGGVSQFKKKSLRLAFPLLMGLWLTLEVFRSYPDFLPYFNQLAGGSKGGINHLDDSNIDWGQDLKRLPKALEKLGIQNFKMQYFGHDLPQYRNLSPENVSEFDRFFPMGDFVVSAHILRRNTLKLGIANYRYDWLQRYQPTRILGHSLYIYRFRFGEKQEFTNGIQWLEKEEWMADGLKRLNQIISDTPHCANCILLLAHAYTKFGQAEEALQVYQKYLTKFKPTAQIFFQLGALHEQLDQTDHAVRAYESSLQVNPNYSNAHFNLGTLYLHQRNFKQAKHHFSEVLRLDAKDAWAHQAMGKLYYDQKEFEKSLYHIDLAKKSGMNIPESFYQKLKASQP